MGVDRQGYLRGWREKNREYLKQSAREHYIANRDRIAEENQALKAEVISEYGEVCACCGEGQIDFLTMDHVNNDGKHHRRQEHNKLYRWLKKNGFPKENFQVLCMNCSWAKRINGKCPHHRSR